MTDSISKIGIDNSAWEITLSDIKGFVVSKSGYVFAVGEYGSVWSLIKYTPLGVFDSSIALGYEPNDICLGYDEGIYIAGEGGYIGKYTQAMATSFSASAGSGISFSQIVVDKQGHAYVFHAVSGTTGKISKYRLSDVSGTALLRWTIDGYTVSGAYWGSYKDPGYWTLNSSQMIWDGTDYVYVGNIYNNASLTVPVGATWQVGLSPEPTQVRISFSGTATVKEISFFAGTPGGSGVLVSSIDYPSSSPVILDCLDRWVTTFRPYRIRVYVDSGGTDDLKITEIEFGSPAEEVAGLTGIAISENNSLYAVGELAGENYSLLSIDTLTGVVATKTDRAYPIDLLTVKDSNTLIISETLPTGDRIVELDLESGTDTWGFTPVSLDVSAFSEGIMGGSAVSLSTPRMTFLSDSITIEGIEVQHVFLEAKMVLSSAPIIVGDKTIVTIPPGLMSFSSEAFPSSTVSVSAPASMDFSSVPVAYNPLSATLVPPKIEFASAPTVEGDETIIVIDPGKMSLSQLAPSIVMMTLVGGASVLNTPPTMSFASDIYIDKEVIFIREAALAEMSFGSIAGVFGPYDSIGDIDIVMPSLFMSSQGPESLNATLPSLTMDGQISSNKIAGLKGAFPCLQIVSESGSEFNTTLSAITCDIDASSNNIADIITVLPKITMGAIATPGGINDFDMIIPSLSVAISAMTGEVANISAILPSTRLEILAITGAASRIDATLPSIKARMIGIKTGDNDMEMVMNIFDMDMSSSEEPATVTSDVLRYVRGKIR